MTNTIDNASHQMDDSFPAATPLNMVAIDSDVAIDGVN